MKISIGSRIIQGPWGGGNLFVQNFKKYLINSGHEVIHDLCDDDIDCILLTDPRSRKESSSTYNHKDINLYKKYVNPNVVVVQRINECDERKDTDYINNFYLNSTKCADHVVFVSSWLREIYLNIGLDKKKTSVIMSGADPEIFNSSGLIQYDDIHYKFVTHHWSSHENKGFEIYSKFDNLLDLPKYKNFEFTYIGNIPKNRKFKNIKVKNPLSGTDLANELKRNNFYLTASKNEPSGNHHIEAAQCGLPILYYESGGIPEYCKDYGVSFNNDFESKLNLIIEKYSIYKENLKSYPYNSNKMCKEFLDIFLNLKNQQLLSHSSKRPSIAFFIILKNRIQKLFLSFSIKQKLISIFKKYNDR